MEKLLYVEEFRPGDKVRSKVYGYYYGIEGVITGKAQVTYNRIPRYNIELLTGQVITLEALQIERIID